MIHTKTLIDDFKQYKAPDKSTVTLAGTGPNGALQVHILNKLGDEYLKSLDSINIISGGAFSFFIYIANILGYFNVDNFKKYEAFVKKRHKLSFLKKITHLATIKFNKKSLYPNTHIEDTFFHLFNDAFGELVIKDINYPVTFYSYDTQSKTIVALNRFDYPDMKLKDVARACISVPPIHGHFDYQGMPLIDPIFSPDFGKLRKTLFKQSHHHLFINHKKTLKTTNVTFLSHSDSRYPNLRLFTDFTLLYFGIPNNHITQTNQSLLSKGIINGH